jgi:hypothetical protein
MRAAVKQSYGVLEPLIGGWDQGERAACWNITLSA